MIDTIVLIMPISQSNLTIASKFDPDAKGLFQPPYIPFAGQHYVQCIQNPSPEDKGNHVYMPRLALTKRKSRDGSSYIITLKIEFSVPKLLYSNNFDEVQDSDFEKVVTTLKHKLFRMGVTIPLDDLKNADVQSIHYGKNIAFIDYTTATSIMDVLRKIKVTRRLDVNHTDYINDGEAVRYHSKSFQVVFYDKIEDLKKAAARAEEKEDRGFNYQTDLFTAIQKKKHPLEVLRMEVRYIGKKSIKAHFKKLRIVNEFTFKSLFQMSIARKVLCDYWDTIYIELKPVLLQNLSISEQFVLIAKQKRQSKPQSILSMIAITSMIKEVGYRKTKQHFDKYFSGRTMERIFKEIKELNFTIANKLSPIIKVTNDLKEFKALKMKDYDIESLM